MGKWSKFSYNASSDSSEYRKGYEDGMNKAFEDSELDAYYAGVGYGKKAAGDKHIGFNNPEERRQFQRGVENKDEHFKVIRVRPPSFLERLFRSFSSKKKFKRKKRREKRYEKRRNKSQNRIKSGKAWKRVNKSYSKRTRRGKRY